MSGARLVELRGLQVRTRTRVLLEGIDVDVDPGRVTALVGPSGAGKSLTARCIMGLVDVSPGVVGGSLKYPAASGEKDWYKGHTGGGTRAMHHLARETAPLRGAYFTYAPQVAASALNPGRTVGRQIELAIRRRTEPVSNLGQEVRDILAEVGLEARTAASLPSEMSGGQCQRAALAIAIAPLPRMVVADEPETGLDPMLRRTVIELMVRVCKDRGCGLLLISHHEDTVERMAQTVVRLSLSGGGE